MDSDSRVAELLLAISDLRLSITADLSAVTGALEVGRPEIAGDVLAGTRRDLADFHRAGQPFTAEPDAR